jgi:hypothetical protein
MAGGMLRVVEAERCWCGDWVWERTGTKLLLQSELEQPFCQVTVLHRCNYEEVVSSSSKDVITGM